MPTGAPAGSSCSSACRRSSIPLPFDDRCAAAYGRVAAATRAAERSHRSRVADLLIAATALAHRLPLYTRNPDDVAHLSGTLDVVAV